MARMIKPMYFDGTKAVPINALPEEAWTVIRGEAEQDTDVAKFYKAVGVLYRCVSIRANAVRSVPWEVRRLASDEPVWASIDEDVPDELSWAQDIKRLVGQAEGALVLTAESFFAKDFNRSRLMDVRWLKPTSVEPQWDKQQGLVGYKRRAGQRTMMLDLDEIVYIYLPPILGETRPDTPPAQAALSEAGVLYHMNMFVDAFFERGAVKATILTADNVTLPEERERLKSWWRRALSGVKNAFNTEVFSGTLKPVVVGEGIQEMSNTDLTGEKRENIATTLGIPHSMVFSNAANFATSHQDKRNFYDETIRPQLDLIEPALNQQLFGPEGYRFRFLPETMDIYQADENERADSLQKLILSGMRPEVAVRVLGYDFPDDIQPEDAFTVMQPSQAPPVGTQEPDAPDMQIEEMRASHLDKWRRKALKRLERNGSPVCDFESEYLSAIEVSAIRTRLAQARSRREISAAFDPEQWEDGAAEDTPFFGLVGKAIPEPDISHAAFKQMILQLDPDDDEAEQQIRFDLEDDTADALEDALGRQRRDLLPSNSTPEDAASVVNRVEATSAPVHDALRRHLVLAADLGVSVATAQMERIGLGFDWTLANIRAREYANTRAGRATDLVNDTTRRMVQQAIVEWIDNGDPLALLIRELEPTFGHKRARTIASTEVTDVYTQATLEGYREAGYRGTPEQVPPLHPNCRCWLALELHDDGSADFIYLTSVDERVCPICGPWHAQRVGRARQPDVARA